MRVNTSIGAVTAIGLLGLAAANPQDAAPVCPLDCVSTVFITMTPACPSIVTSGGPATFPPLELPSTSVSITATVYLPPAGSSGPAASGVFGVPGIPEVPGISVITATTEGPVPTPTFQVQACGEEVTDTYFLWVPGTVGPSLETVWSTKTLGCGLGQATLPGPGLVPGGFTALTTAFTTPFSYTFTVAGADSLPTPTVVQDTLTVTVPLPAGPTPFVVTVLTPTIYHTFTSTCSDGQPSLSVASAVTPVTVTIPCVQTGLPGGTTTGPITVPPPFPTPSLSDTSTVTVTTTIAIGGPSPAGGASPGTGIGIPANIPAAPFPPVVTVSLPGGGGGVQPGSAGLPESYSSPDDVGVPGAGARIPGSGVGIPEADVGLPSTSSSVPTFNPLPPSVTATVPLGLPDSYGSSPSLPAQPLPGQPLPGQPLPGQPLPGQSLPGSPTSIYPPIITVTIPGGAGLPVAVNPGVGVPASSPGQPGTVQGPSSYGSPPAVPGSLPGSGAGAPGSGVGIPASGVGAPPAVPLPAGSAPPAQGGVSTPCPEGAVVTTIGTSTWTDIVSDETTTQTFYFPRLATIVTTIGTANTPVAFAKRGEIVERQSVPDEAGPGGPAAAASPTSAAASSPGPASVSASPTASPSIDITTSSPAQEIASSPAPAQVVTPSPVPAQAVTSPPAPARAVTSSPVQVRLGTGTPPRPTQAPPSPIQPLCVEDGAVATFDLDFDDGFPPGPIFNPVQYLWFSEYFLIKTPGMSPYVASSGSQLAEFIPAARVPTAHSSSLNIAQIGVGDDMSLPCFRFNWYGMDVGCEASSPWEVCDFSIHGYVWNPATKSQELVTSQELAVPPCPAQRNCPLTPISGIGFDNLTSIFVEVTVNRQPAIWWVDDIEFGWTDNSCPASDCRAAAPTQFSRREAMDTAIRRGIWQWTPNGLKRLVGRYARWSN